MCWWMKIISHSPLWASALLWPLCAPHNTCVNTSHPWVSFHTHLCLQLAVSYQALFSDLVLPSFIAIAALLAWWSFISPWGHSQWFTDADGSCSCQEPPFLGFPEHWSLSGGVFLLQQTPQTMLWIEYDPERSSSLCLFHRPVVLTFEVITLR